MFFVPFVVDLHPCNATSSPSSGFTPSRPTRLQLKLIAGANGLKRIIREPTVNRPGLALAGFTRYFANKRVQVIGNAESHFLKSLPKEDARRVTPDFFAYKIPCVVFCRDLQPDKLSSKPPRERTCRCSNAR